VTAVSGRISEFRERGCDVLGISTDSIATHERWIATSPAEGGVGELHFPLASDESGSVCRSYGVYVPRQKIALRGLFIVDPNGVLQYQVVHSVSVGRNTEEMLRVLEGLQMGGLCPGERQRGEAGLDASQELGPNRIIGPYQIEARLGGGTFGMVFRAHDRTLDRTVALKVIRSGSPVPPEALLAEARAAAALNHPNVCTIHAVDSSLGAPMIVMEYVDGHPLSRLIHGAALQHAEASSLGRQIALGIAAAHGQGVVHGDLKPANVLVTPARVAKIVDFGMARRRSSAPRGDETGIWTPSPSGGISGTPAYMAPEQARAEPALPASDVFALGLILYEMLTGRRARPDEDILHMLRWIDHEDPVRYAAETPEPFATILRQALIADPAQRQISMTEIAHQLG
jgi:serine/threonine protein kinase/peroxiredoxin